MKNPEVAFARAFGASAQVATFQMPGPRGNAAATQAEAHLGHLRFNVDLSPSVAEGRNEVGYISTLAWADARTPVAVLGVCLGKLFVAVALNPLDESTRALMRCASQTGTLNYSVRFTGDSALSSEGFEVIRSLSDKELFVETLLATEGMQCDQPERWHELAAQVMGHRLIDEGFDTHIRARLNVRAFKALSVEMEQEATELSAVC